jgi:hypothetical protein
MIFLFPQTVSASRRDRHARPRGYTPVVTVSRCTSYTYTQSTLWPLHELQYKPAPTYPSRTALLDDFEQTYSLYTSRV